MLVCFGTSSGVAVRGYSICNLALCFFMCRPDAFSSRSWPRAAHPDPAVAEITTHGSASKTVN